MPDEALIREIITVSMVLTVIGVFAVFILPLHPRLPGWVTWQEYRRSEERAERLLREVLGKSQYQRFLRLGFIEVPSHTHAGRVYRIRRWPEKVAVIEQGQVVALLCAETLLDVPSADMVLAHKLMLEANEEEYLRIANNVP